MQFTSIPTWFSIGQSVAESHIVWWKLHATRSQWLPSIQPSRTCFAIDCDNIIINNISHAGNKLCAKVDLWRWKAKLQLSIFFQEERARVRTRQPEIKLSKRRFRGGEGVIAVVGSRAIMFDKMGPSNPAEHFSQRLPKYAVWGEAGWEKTQIYRWEDCFSCCLPIKSPLTITVDLFGN